MTTDELETAELNIDADKLTCPRIMYQPLC